MSEISSDSNVLSASDVKSIQVSKGMYLHSPQIGVTLGDLMQSHEQLRSMWAQEVSWREQKIFELEKCKQMLEVAEKTLEWLQAGFAGMWGCPEEIWYEEALETAPDKIEQALAKIEEMRAKK